MGTPRTVHAMVMRIVTKFVSVDEFVESFRRFCVEDGCFIPSAQAKKVGIETGFSLRLADGGALLRGLCVVREAYADEHNPFGRPGVVLGFRKLTPDSEAVFARLRAPVAGADEVDDKATIEMAPLFPDPAVYEETAECDSGGIPEPIDAVPSNEARPRLEITRPSPGIAAEAAMLMRPVSGEIAARDGRDDIATVPSRPSALIPTPAVVMSYDAGDGQVGELATADLTVPSRAPVMTLLGVMPLEPARPKRVSMPAITNPIAPLQVATGSAEHPIALPEPAKRTWWERVVGRLRAMVRTVRWAYRRRRGVRASLRRLPTRTG